MKTVTCTLCLSKDCQKEMQRTQNHKNAVCLSCKLERNRKRQLQYWNRKGKAKRDGYAHTLESMKGGKIN